MAAHSSSLALKIPRTEEPGRLQSMGSLRVRHDWATSLSLSCIGEGNGNPLQCSCLENPRDGGAWWAAVYAVATHLKWLSSSSNGRKRGNTIQHDGKTPQWHHLGVGKFPGEFTVGISFPYKQADKQISYLKVPQNTTRVIFPKSFVFQHLFAILKAGENYANQSTAFSLQGDLGSDHVLLKVTLLPLLAWGEGGEGIPMEWTEALTRHSAHLWTFLGQQPFYSDWICRK